MADETSGKAEQSAEERVRAAEEALEAARAELAESQGDLRALRTQNVPMMLVRLKPNVHVQHEGKDYFGDEYGVRFDDDGNPAGDRLLHGDDNGQELVLDGPTAMSLVLEGQVDIVRSVVPGEEEE
jgi:hypothetical protein